MAKLLNAVGTILMVLVILLAAPLTVPKLFGYQIYNVLTGSMEPDYPAGSAVYVKQADYSEIEAGDVITFRLGTDTDLPATHRVTAVNEEKQEFVTKGDANRSEDITAVSFDRVIGKVEFGIPMLGMFSGWLFSMYGIIGCAAVFLVTVILWRTAAKLKLKESSK